MVLTSRQAGIWQERVYLHGGDFTVELHAFRQLRVRRSDDEQVIGEDRAGRWFPQLVERGLDVGLAAGVQVITSGLVGLPEGTPVRVAE